MKYLTAFFALVSFVCLIVALINWVRSLASHSEEKSLKASIAGWILYTAGMFFGVLRGICSLMEAWSGAQLAITVIMFLGIFLGIKNTIDKQWLLKNLKPKEKQQISPKERLANLRKEKARIDQEILALEAKEETESGLVFRQNDCRSKK